MVFAERMISSDKRILEKESWDLGGRVLKKKKKRDPEGTSFAGSESIQLLWALCSCNQSNP